MAKREAESASAFSRGIGVSKFNLEMLGATIAAIAAITLVWTFSQPDFPVPVLVVSGAVFTVSVVVVIRLMMDPDSVRALQSDAMLQLASSMIDAMGEGLTARAAQEVCELLLPNTSAIAVALTNRESVLGYAGYQEAHNPAGIAIRTSATHEAIRQGETLVLLTPEEIGLPKPADESRIKAAIVEPLWVGNRVEGTLKFYYRNGNKITETQRSIAHGFAQLLATQMAAVEMETQRKLATAMELKMLQSQINPHFLFNTINTIASFIRTDPMKARTLLREFAVFYRRTHRAYLPGSGARPGPALLQFRAGSLRRGAPGPGGAGEPGTPVHDGAPFPCAAAGGECHQARHALRGAAHHQHPGRGRRR